MWCVGDHCFFRALDVGLKVMVSSTLAASLTCLSLFSCDSILFSFSSSLSSLGGSILLEDIAWSACSSCSLNLFSVSVVHLSSSPVNFFVYHPLTASCFLSAFLFRTLPAVSFWESFISQRQKHIHLLICFLPVALRHYLFSILSVVHLSSSPVSFLSIDL